MYSVVEILVHEDSLLCLEFEKMINISICFSFDTGDKKNPYVHKQIMIIECNKISLWGCLSLPKTVVFLSK